MEPKLGRNDRYNGRPEPEVAACEQRRCLGAGRRQHNGRGLERHDAARGRARPGSDSHAGGCKPREQRRVLQIALDLASDGAPIDASRWAGIELDLIGNDESYNLHPRTADVARPWQSYRQSFIARPQWQTLRLPFADFEAHQIDAPLDLSTLPRIGMMPCAFHADIAIGGVRFHS